MDFSAWFEVYLENRWWAFDARNNVPRIGRILMATGRDAADVAFLTSFGAANLKSFLVISDEIKDPATLQQQRNPKRTPEGRWAYTCRSLETNIQIDRKGHSYAQLPCASRVHSRSDCRVYREAAGPH